MMSGGVGPKRKGVGYAAMSKQRVYSSHVTLDTVLTKRYRPFETIGTDTNVSSVASNGQKPRDQSRSVEVTSEAAKTKGVLFKRLKDIRNH